MFKWLHFLYFIGSGTSCGKIIQRFPEKDWEDCPFTQGIELVSVIKSAVNRGYRNPSVFSDRF